MPRHGLAGLLGAIANDFDNEDEKPALSHEETLARLKSAAGRYGIPCVFHVGDVVTPRGDGIYGGAGQPMIVVAVQADAKPVFEGTSDTPYYGKIIDMRVLRMSDDNVVPFWVESADFEPYVAPLEPAETADQQAA